MRGYSLRYSTASSHCFSSFAGGADFSGAFEGFVGGVKATVRGQDEVGLLGDAQYFLKVYAALLQGFCLIGEEQGVQHYAGAYEICVLVLEDTGGNGTEYIFLALELKGVAGVGAALKSCHRVVTGS